MTTDILVCVIKMHSYYRAKTQEASYDGQLGKFNNAFFKGHYFINEFNLLWSRILKASFVTLVMIHALVF